MQVNATALPGVPDVKRGADLAGLLKQSLDAAGYKLRGGDVISISQKVVSKSEGRTVDLGEVEVSAGAERIAGRNGADPRVVQVVLNESDELVREHPVLIAISRTGHICANAGVDLSNVEAEDTAVLLPLDPDESARKLRRDLTELTGTGPAIVISDSFGRPWRLGQVDFAIGCAGLLAFDDHRGDMDRYGRILSATCTAVADQIAAAADLARAKDSGHPFILIRGLGKYVTDEDGPGARAILRPESEDLFR